MGPLATSANPDQGPLKCGERSRDLGTDELNVSICRKHDIGAEIEKVRQMCSQQAGRELPLSEIMSVHYYEEPQRSYSQPSLNFSDMRESLKRYDRPP